ncbi:MAG: hypothetical protein A2734_02870 [Parcubacteria group bacterium RIFCSPHIGHO2_01_FULL_40_30]|nr:MAG: hypothetical protein A2734_02870 [Parcubacteria group bacterium RIFCSPHIGHO2_01_FULL_40_30]
MSIATLSKIKILLGFLKLNLLPLFCYNTNMTWDYTKTEYEKQAEKDPVWELERLINYGLRKEKIDRKKLEKYLAELKISDDRRAFFELLLWNKKL